MKYIRTKDGRIIDLERKGLYNLPVYNFDTKENVLKAHQNQEDRNCCCIDNNIFYDYCYEDGTLWEYEIVKQADTIEELCDEYYGVDENGAVCRVYNWSKDAYPPKPHEWAVDGFCTKEDITISELKNHFPKGIFGAVVWFDDKGNLHIDIVAKMNDKGGLELL